MEYLNYAIEYYKVHKSENDKNTELFIEYSNLVGESYMANQDFQKLQDYLNNMLKQVGNEKHESQNICFSYLLLAQATVYQDKKTAMGYLEKAEKIAEKNNFHDIIGTANFYKHSMFYASITPQESLIYLNKAQINFEKYYQGKPNPNLVSVLTSKAAMLGHMGDFVAAERGFEQGSKLTIAFYGRDK